VALANAFDGVRASFDNLNERERRLVSLLGVVFAIVVVGLPLYLTTSAISELEEHNTQISDVLSDLGRAQATLQTKQAERAAEMRRFEHAPPPLGTFIEDQARRAGVTLGNIQPEPDQAVNGYTKKQVRVTIPNTGLRGVIDLMASIENSDLPVAISQLHVEHFAAGDRFNVTLGVVAFERAAGSGGTGATKNTKAPARSAGPPAP